MASFIDHYNSLDDVGSAVNPDSPAAYYTALNKQKRLSQLQAKQKKGPSGIAGFLTSALPAIASGIGAVGGTFVAPGAGTVGGGAAGGAVGEALKRKILGQKEDIGQIATQGLEGGVFAGAGSALRGISGGAKAAVGVKTASTAEKTAGLTKASRAAKTSENLITQGEQMQSRGLGTSGGAKVAGQELQPHDSSRMLTTLKNEGIKLGNANSVARDVNTKLGQYGKQIGDHFTGNNAPLSLAEKKTISADFLHNLSSTDPTLEKQANILANDFEKNVKDTKGLWEFRKTLDSKIPDTKFMDENTTAKVTALKEFRGHLSNQIGEVPGMSNYHALSEIKPFLGKGMRELNQPTGGLTGRVLSSGPVQKVEQLLGAGTEKAGKALGGKTDPLVRVVAKDGSENIVPQSMADASGVKSIPVQSVEETATASPKTVTTKNLLINPKVGEVTDAEKALVNKGYGVKGKASTTTGRYGGGQVPVVQMAGKKTVLPFESSGASTTQTLTGTGLPQTRAEVIANGKKVAAGASPPPDIPSTPGLLSRVARTAVTAPAIPLAYPGKTAAAVTKQLVPRIPAIASPQDQNPIPDSAQLTPDEQALLDNPPGVAPKADASTATAGTDYDQLNQQLMQAAQEALASGDTKGLANITNFASMVQSMQKASQTTSKPLNATQQTYKNNATSALQDISSISDMLGSDPNIAKKDAAPLGALGRHLAGATDFDAAKGNIIDVLGHLRTGAAISAQEEKTYKGLIPGPFDSVDQARRKLNRLANYLAPFANPESTGGSDISDLLSNAGVQ